MNLRNSILFLLAAWAIVDSGQAQTCQSGDSSECGQHPILKFRGVAYAQVGVAGTLTASVAVDSETAKSFDPPDVGRTAVTMHEEKNNPDALPYKKIKSKPEKVHNGTLQASATIDPNGNGNGSDSRLAALFDTEDDCGLDLEISTKVEGTSDTWTEWEKGRAVLTRLPADLAQGKTLDFRVRFHKKEESEGNDGSGGADDGEGKDMKDHVFNYPPEIPKEEQDVPPTVPGVPNQLNPAGFQSSLSLGSSPTSGGYNTGSVWLSGPISPGLADVSKLVLADPDGNGLSVVLSAGNLRQVTNLTRLMDIQPSQGGGFDVKFYESGSFGTTQVAGLYPITGSPSVTVNYAPVAAVPSEHNGGVRVITTGPNQIPRQHEVLAISSDGCAWKEVLNGGTEVRETACSYIFDAGHWHRIDLNTVTRGGVLVSKTQSTYLYQYRRAGSPAVMVENELFKLEERVFDKTNTSFATTWEPDTRIGQVKSVTRPDGSWEAYTYYTGSEPGAYPSWKGMLKETLRPWNGAPASPSLATSANSEFTVLVYDEDPSTEGVGEGRKVTRRTTHVPGCANPVKDWTVAQAAGVSSLISLLGNQGLSAHWIPSISDIEGESGAELANSGEQIPSHSYSYRGSHIAGSPWIGRQFASLDDQGNGSVTGYERGTYNSSTGEFEANDPSVNANDGTHVRSITLNLIDGGWPLGGEATKEISINDYRGQSLRKELWVLDEFDAWNLAGTTVFEYPTLWADGSPREVIESRDGRIVSHSLVDLSGQRSEFDEQGIETRTTFDGLGRTATVTRVGSGSQPDIVTTYNYGFTKIDDHDFPSTQISATAGVLTRSQGTTVEDLAGRTISETSPSGAVTTTTYPNGGRDTLTSLPGGLTRLVSRSIDGRTLSVTGSAVVDEVYSYEVLPSGNLVTTRRVGDLANSPRYTITEEDWAGRTRSVTSPSPTGSGDVSTISDYANGTRRLVSSTSPAGTLLFEKPDSYSAKTRSGLNVDGAAGLDPASGDRVSETASLFSVDGNGLWWEQSTRKVYDSTTSFITTVSMRCLNGNPDGFASRSISISPSEGTVEVNTSIDRVNKTLTTTEIQTDVTNNAVSVNVNGLLVSQKGHDAANPTRWDYDEFGQPIREVSPRGAVSRKTYYADGSLHTATDASNQTTTYAYYAANTASAGRLMTVTDPINKITTYTYSNLGQVTIEEETKNAAFLSRLSYDYDLYGAKNKMWTWRDSTTSDLTEWIYQPGTGFLLEKKDAAGKSVIHTYTAAGKPDTRTWARGVTTTYAYDPATGDLTGIDYSDATPDVILSGHDLLGRPGSITQSGVGSETLTYHPGKGTPFARYYDSAHALLPGKGIRNSLPDALERAKGFVETSGANTSTLRTVGYTYSPATGLLSTVTDGTQSHTYGYHPNSSLVSTIHSNTSGTAWFRETRHYDLSNRLLGIRSDRMSDTTLTAEISSHGYDYDEIGRRTKNTFQDGSYWQYGYNDRSEVTSAIRKTAAGTEVTPLAAVYTYDGIGNRLTSTSPVLGDHTYTPNSLNQYATITTADSRTAVGRAPSAWTIQVAGVTASRIGEIFYRPLTASNGTAPVWQDVVIKRDTDPPPATPQHFWYAQASFAPTYDFDGNLTNDGRWTYLWDAENRLIQMETTTQATGAGHSYTKLVFAYDWQGRRIARHVWQTGTQAAPVFKSSRRWLYDGWNVITEFTAPSATSTTLTRANTFTWGLDLSGTLQGAGGVGGLLVQTAVSGGVIERASYDGNGNIVAWTKSNAAAPTSRREYDAFGNTLVSEGAAPSTFGFSTKMQDVETALYYYGYRFYDPVTGRWPSRDPIGEQGGLNIYGFSKNCPISVFDVTGLWDERVHKDKTIQWGVYSKVQKWAAKLVGEYDNKVDKDKDPTDPANWSWHFNRNSTGEDSREKWYEIHLQKAKDLCDFIGKGKDDPVGASKELGTSLHPKQDISAHGDYDRAAEMPSPDRWKHKLKLIHNYIAPFDGSTKWPDEPSLDVDTPDGFPSYSGRHYQESLDSSNVAIGHRYKPGVKRYLKTRQDTLDAYEQMRSFISSNGGRKSPHCKCRWAYGVPL